MRWGFAAAAGSFALLAAAFGFQALGYPPCAICLWQRWAHVAAIAAGLLLILAPRPAAALGALASVTGAGIALYHTGIERGWWPGPASCTGSGGGLGEDLLSTAGRVVLCDQVAWSFAGLSMASWNGLASLGLFFLWLKALGSLGKE